MQTKAQQPQGFPQPLITGMVYLPAPVRFLDTRATATIGCVLPAAPIATNSDNLYNPRISCTGVPAEARGIFGNITILGMTTNGFVTLYPDSSSLRIDYSVTPPVTNRPFVATVNYRTAVAVQNQPINIGLGKNGKFWLYNNATGSSIEVIIDLVGYVV